MKSNQSLHLTIKQPPNPNPVRTIAVFSDVSDKALPGILTAYLSEVKAMPKDAKFLENVKDEVLQALATGTVLTVAREGKLLHITIREP